MLQVLAQAADRILQDWQRVWRREPQPATTPRDASPTSFEPVSQVTLTDEVARTLFAEYARHRQTERGDDETGWILLGLRDRENATVMATLPAGSDADAGVAHVRFNSNAQTVGSRMVRQLDRRLTILGVVHTHPGSLRHPSDGDYRGDRQWVGQLRGREGIFGIGTADNRDGDARVSQQPKPNLQTFGELCFSWYGLGENDRHYRPLPWRIVLGPDMALPLHEVWSTIEEHAEAVERLCRQQQGVTLDVVADKPGMAVAVNVPLAEPGKLIRVLLQGPEARYYMSDRGQMFQADLDESRVDRGVYLMMAELTAKT